MNVNGVGPSLPAIASADHRSPKSAGLHDKSQVPANSAGKPAQSPAFQARALIAGDPTLGDERFGKIVSRIARGELPEEPSAPLQTDPDPVDPATTAGPSSIADATI